MLIHSLINNNSMKFSTGYSQLADILVENSVYFKWLNKHTFVLFKPP